ncbi:hypothetical protein GW846_04345 [Candidatus Gracilibacteria bacterium]|nr:hypothetical protein [Candidatus Gracilibacteria bacterium]
MKNLLGATVIALSGTGAIAQESSQEINNVKFFDVGDFCGATKIDIGTILTCVNKQKMDELKLAATGNYVVSSSGEITDLLGMGYGALDKALSIDADNDGDVDLEIFMNKKTGQFNANGNGVYTILPESYDCSGNKNVFTCSEETQIDETGVQCSENMRDTHTFFLSPFDGNTSKKVITEKIKFCQRDEQI